jgi:hypothetical protein
MCLLRMHFSCKSKLLLLVIVHDFGRLDSGGPHVKLMRSYATMFIDLQLLLHSVMSTMSFLQWSRLGQRAGNRMALKFRQVTRCMTTSFLGVQISRYSPQVFPSEFLFVHPCIAAGYELGHDITGFCVEFGNRLLLAASGLLKFCIIQSVIAACFRTSDVLEKRNSVIKASHIAQRFICQKP